MLSLWHTAGLGNGQHSGRFVLRWRPKAFINVWARWNAYARRIHINEEAVAQEDYVIVTLKVLLIPFPDEKFTIVHRLYYSTQSTWLLLWLDSTTVVAVYRYWRTNGDENIIYVGTPLVFKETTKQYECDGSSRRWKAMKKYYNRKGRTLRSLFNDFQVEFNYLKTYFYYH